MPAILFRRDGDKDEENYENDELLLPAPHPERIAVRRVAADGTAEERLTLRFTDLDEAALDALRAFRLRAEAAGPGQTAFDVIDESGCSGRYAFAGDARAVRRAPGDWDVTVDLIAAADASVPPDPAIPPETWPAGWMALQRPPDGDILALPPPDAAAREEFARVQAVGRAADGTRHVHDAGRAVARRTYSWGALSQAHWRALAEFHDAVRAGRDEFACVADGLSRTVRFADGPLAGVRTDAGAWRAAFTLIEDR